MIMMMMMMMMMMMTETNVLNHAATLYNCQLLVVNHHSLSTNSIEEI